MPYVALQSMLDETAPHGWRFYDRLHYLPEVSDDFVDALVDGFEQRRRPQAHVVTGWMGGAIDRVAPARPRSATAARAPHLDHRLLRATSRSSRCATGCAASGTTRRRFATGGVYVNALDADRPVRDAYADDVWERLVAVKRRYDPGRRASPATGIG